MLFYSKKKEKVCFFFCKSVTRWQFEWLMKLFQLSGWQTEDLEFKYAFCSYLLNHILRKSYIFFYQIAYFAYFVFMFLMQHDFILISCIMSHFKKLSTEFKKRFVYFRILLKLNFGDTVCNVLPNSFHIQQMQEKP